MQLAHDPDARLDYTWNWDDWLQPGEIITSHYLEVEPTQPADGLMVDTSDIFIGGRMVVAWLQGGVPKTAVGVTCHIVTSEGREDDRTHDIWVKER